MKLIMNGRGTGKTTKLIYASEVTGIPIATYSKTNAEYIKDMAERMGCNIPEPTTYYDLANNHHCGNMQYKSILADDIDSILQKALNSYLNCHVIGATMTPRDCV